MNIFNGKGSLDEFLLNSDNYSSEDRELIMNSIHNWVTEAEVQVIVKDRDSIGTFFHPNDLVSYAQEEEDDWETVYDKSKFKEALQQQIDNYNMELGITHYEMGLALEHCKYKENETRKDSIEMG